MLGKGVNFFHLLVDSTDLHLDTTSSLKPTIHMKIKTKKCKKKHKKLSGNMELQHQLDKPKLDQNL